MTSHFTPLLRFFSSIKSIGLSLILVTPFWQSQIGVCEYFPLKILKWVLFLSDMAFRRFNFSSFWKESTHSREKSISTAQIGQEKIDLHVE